MAMIIKPLIDAGKAAAAYLAPDIVIKFCKDERQKGVIITEADIGVYQLQKNVRLLADTIDALEVERTDTLNRVRTCLRTDNKLMVS